MSDELPFGITRRPRVADTKAALCCVDDHLSTSDVMIQTWWSGEGFTLQIDCEGKRELLDLSWQEWEALRLCVEAVLEAD